MRVPRVLAPLVRRSAGPAMYALARLAGGSPPGLRRGAGLEPADVPVVLVVVPGATEEHVTAVLGAVRTAQWATDGFTPVLVVDTPVLPVVRRAGYAVELTTARDLGAAVEEARTSYSATTVLVAPPGAVGVVGDVLLHLRVEPSSPLRTLRGRLRAVEARLR